MFVVCTDVPGGAKRGEHGVSEREGSAADRVPTTVEALVKQLLVTHKAVRLYPAASHIPRENAAQVVAQLRQLISQAPVFRLGVSKNALLYRGLPVLPGMAAVEAFAREFYSHHLSDVRFHAGVTEDEIVGFLEALQEEPALGVDQTDFESRLWDRHVVGVTATEVGTTVLDIQGPGITESGAAWPPPNDAIERLLAATTTNRPQERRIVVRFIHDPRLVARFLSEMAGQPGSDEAVAWLSERIAAMAHVAAEELAEDAPAISRAVAESVLGLDPVTRRRLVMERLLPDARLDDSLADVIRQMGVRDVCDVIAEGLGRGEGAREGILRAIRNLAALTSEDRESVAAKAHAALVAAGASESEAAALVETALPTQLRQNPDTEPADSRLATEIAGIAETMWRSVEIGPDEIAGLREEAGVGLTDGDVVFTLVTLLANERRQGEFSRLMESVEDGLGMLVDWGEYEAAATSAAALDVLTRAQDLTVAERERAEHALVGMATSARLQKVAATMRVFRAGSPENAACRRLLEVLGEHAISPLLEVLARESDMSARKQIIDIISGVAAQHVSALGRRVGDPQWFVVRNVVSILGATRDPAVLAYLPGPLRHADTRVRRETIRALANIRDRRSVELLTAALNDADQQNVQLAARHLGALGATDALDALAAVAAGDTRSVRDVTPRIEAIEALGEIGGPRAEGLLADIASRRSLLGGGRSREVRAAAEAALARLRARAREEAGSDV